MGEVKTVTRFKSCVINAMKSMCKSRWWAMRCQGDKEQPREFSVNTIHSSRGDTHLFEEEEVEQVKKDLVVVKG